MRQRWHFARHAGVRDAIVAMKPWKLGGAKGVRKVDEVCNAGLEDQPDRSVGNNCAVGRHRPLRVYGKSRLGRPHAGVPPSWRSRRRNQYLLRRGRSVLAGAVPPRVRPVPSRTHQPESRMREIRPYGSEGGAAGLTGRPYPYCPVWFLFPCSSDLGARRARPIAGTGQHVVSGGRRCRGQGGQRSAPPARRSADHRGDDRTAQDRPTFDIGVVRGANAGDAGASPPAGGVRGLTPARDTPPRRGARPAHPTHNPSAPAGTTQTPSGRR